MELEQPDLNKIDTRGKWSNRSLDGHPNKGTAGKLTAEQLEERLNLHARRLANGVPTIAAIVAHWKNKYGIYMHMQSEKDWAIKHKGAIMQRQEELITKGEIQITGVSDKSLVAALADGARSEASMLRVFEGKMKKLANNINTIVDTWDILGIKKEEYLSTTDERREMLDKKAELEIKSKKDNLEFLKGFSIISKNCAEKLIEMIKLAYEINKNTSLSDMNIKREAVSLAREIVKRTKAKKNEISAIDVQDFKEIEMEKLREEVGIGKDSETEDK